MNILLDTNILLYIARGKVGNKLIQFVNPDEVIVYISFVSVAEIESLAFQQRWSDEKRNRLMRFLENVRVVDISDLLVSNYVDIDAFSQRKHPAFSQYAFATPRNMGKHDLWRSAVTVAATAALLNLTLVTTDADFDHLRDAFLSIRSISSDDIRRLLN